MNSLRETAIIGVLVILILALGTFYVLLSPEYPEEPKLPRLEDFNGIAEIDEPTSESLTKIYPDMGQKAVFHTLIPTPTPKPTPVPTPLPYPKLELVTKGWLLVGLDTGMAEFQVGEKYIEMKVGEVFEAVTGKYTLDVRLDKVDLQDYKAELRAQDTAVDEDWKQMREFVF